MLERLPRIPLGRFPTPVEELDLAAIEPAFRGRAWVKREDRSAGDAGGNKVRKLEYLLGEARERDATVVVTTGGFGSNHCLATAWHARTADLRTHLILFPQPMSDAARAKLRAICSLQPGLTVTRSANTTPVAAAAAKRRLRAAGERPFVVPPGGSSATGVLGFASAALEIACDVAAGRIEEPDAIVVAASSGGSAAGLLLGCALAGLRSRVLAIAVYPRPVTSAWLVRRQAARARARLEALGARVPPIDATRLHLDHAWLGAGYARPTPAGDEALRAASSLGLTLDATYTAKAFAALRAAAATPAWRDKRLLFVHTYDGRVPAPLPPLDPSALPPAVRAALGEP